MIGLGATGTDKQFADVGRYILTWLTIVKINDVPSRELAMLLNMPESVAEAIVVECEQQAFCDTQGLLRVPGLD